VAFDRRCNQIAFFVVSGLRGIDVKLINFTLGFLVCLDSVSELFELFFDHREIVHFFLQLFVSNFKM
jgi:hypothetical protein